MPESLLLRTAFLENNSGGCFCTVNQLLGCVAQLNHSLGFVAHFQRQSSGGVV